MNQDAMPSTKDRLGAYDAIETAKPGEPLFPIQGGDPFGPETVLHWATLARTAGLKENDAEKAAHLLRKACDAEQVAWAMSAYQRGEQTLEGERAQYNDAGALEEEDHERIVRRARIKGADRLYSLVGEATEIAGELEQLKTCMPEVAALREAIAMISLAALTIEPRRGRERS